MINEIERNNVISERSRLFCPMERTMSEIFFSLMDYRNNYFTSDDPNKIIEFYNGFENRDQLIRWMKGRPKGVANIHEVDGDKYIIIVIPTADFNGKYAKECRESIFKGLHMVFVESGEVPDPYFNYAHNCNVGIKKAMEYNPKWIVVSNDDMIKIDEIEKLIAELKTLLDKDCYMVYCKKKKNNPNRVKLSYTTARRNFIFRLFKRYNARYVVHFERKFDVKYLVAFLNFPYRILFKTKYTFPAIADFAVLSSKILNTITELYDETFINSGEDIDLSLRIYLSDCAYKITNFRIGSIGGGSLGGNRMLRGLTGSVYMNHKIDKISEFDKRMRSRTK